MINFATSLQSVYISVFTCINVAKVLFILLFK